MNSRQRKTKLLDLLQASDCSICGRELALKLHVSRQVIVNDIAHLRAAGHPIMSTTTGYVHVSDKDPQPSCTFFVRHDENQIEDELQTIVDLGGEVLDVAVEHKVYGSIQKPLAIKSRLDVDLFVEHMRKKKTRPLMDLTDGMHAHKVRAQNMDILQAIEHALEQKGYLVSVKRDPDRNGPSQA